MFALASRQSPCQPKDRIGFVYRNASQAALLAAPAFFVLFFSLLLALWYLESVSSWLAFAGATLIVTMSATTAMFWLATGGADSSLPKRRIADSQSPIAAATGARIQPVPIGMKQMRTMDCSACQHNDSLFKVECFKASCGAIAPSRKFALYETLAPEAGTVPASADQ